MGGGADEMVGGGADRGPDPPRGAHADDALPFDPALFGSAAADLPPDFMTDVTPRNLRNVSGLDQRAHAFSQGLTLPASHQQATGEGFRPKFDCPTAAAGEQTIFQEDRSGIVRAVRVGAPKDQSGIIKLYAKETKRLNRANHPDAPVLQEYVYWLLEQFSKQSQKPDAIKALLAHDQETREDWSLDGFTFSASSLNSSWSLCLSSLALSSTAPPPHRYQRGGGDNEGGGGGGGGRNRQRDRKNKNPQGGGDHTRHPSQIPCRDFIKNKCRRGKDCIFKH